jgi:HEPN domain-containing protein
MKPEVLVWTAKAEEDLLAAEWLLKENSPVVLPAVFHIQQSVGKFLKGYLTSQEIRFEKKHDLTYLLALAPNSEFQEFCNFCEELSPFAVGIRYPGDSAALTRDEGLALLDQLQDFRKVVYRFLHSPTAEGGNSGERE